MSAERLMDDPCPSTLDLRDVELSRGGRVLVSGLSFSLMTGQLALIVGPNGSGKTTLLRTIAGLAPPSGGLIRLGGRNIFGLEPDERRQMTYQGHLDGLKKDLTIGENISFYSGIRDIPSSYSSVLSELGLEALEDRSVGRLSAGQRRRAGLAVLRLSGANLWLLDEPLTNLDQAGRDLVSRWVNQHIDQGGMAVVATHLATALQRPGCLLVEL